MSYQEPIDFTFDSPQEIGFEQNARNSGGSGGSGNIFGQIIGWIVEEVGEWFNGWLNRRAQRQENEKDRKFNAEQAEINRKWQEEQYKKYESVAAQMQQRHAAGLNPNDQIQAMSVGSGSTASSSSHSLPPIQADFSLFSQLPSIIAGLQKTKAETQGIKIKNQTDLLLLRQEAIKTGDFETYWSSIVAEQGNKEKLSEWEWKKKRAEAYKTFHEARKAKEDADQYEDFGNNGGNTYTDSSNLSVSQTELNEANTATVDALRNHLVEVQKASAESLKASASLAREQCNKTKEETEKLSDEDTKRTWDVTIGQFFGLADISVLTPELQAKAAQYYWDFQHGNYSYESTISAFQDQINRYVEKNGHIVQSTSVNHSMGVKIGPISGNASSGKSGTF